MKEEKKLFVVFSLESKHSLSLENFCKSPQLSRYSASATCKCSGFENSISQGSEAESLQIINCHKNLEETKNAYFYIKKLQIIFFRFFW